MSGARGARAPKPSRSGPLDVRASSSTSRPADSRLGVASAGRLLRRRSPAAPWPLWAGTEGRCAAMVVPWTSVGLGPPRTRLDMIPGTHTLPLRALFIALRSNPPHPRAARLSGSTSKTGACTSNFSDNRRCRTDSGMPSPGLDFARTCGHARPDPDLLTERRAQGQRREQSRRREASLDLPDTSTRTGVSRPGAALRRPLPPH